MATKNHVAAHLWHHLAQQTGLQAYLDRLADIERRDHRRLGKELDLFSLHEEAGAGLAYWHPKGGRMRVLIEDFWRMRHYEGGYEILFTPHIGRSWLWETSGHLDFYREGMYAPMQIDEQNYYIKPMNCPFHILIYQTQSRSYRDLPLRWAEMGTVYRYEKSGVLHGLLRVRGFTQDDAHIICTPEQIEDEILGVLRFSLALWRDFGFENVNAYLATRPEHSVASRPAGIRPPSRCARPSRPSRCYGWTRAAAPLRPQDRPQDQGCAGARVADDDHHSISTSPNALI